jgi:hypothetical protein
MSAVENCSARRDENLPLKDSASDVSVRPDKAMIFNRAGVTSACPYYGILHNDTVPSNSYCPASFANNARPMQDASPNPDHNISANRRIRRDPSRWIDLRLLAVVHDQHLSSSLVTS